MSDWALRCPGGQDKGCVLKLSWPSTAEYLQDDEIKKKPHFLLLRLQPPLLLYHTCTIQYTLHHHMYQSTVRTDKDQCEIW